MTRSRRSSLYVAPLGRGLPITSTRRKAAPQKSRLDSVIETPVEDVKKEDKENEVSFTALATKKKSRKSSSMIKESKVIISPIKKAALAQAFKKAERVPSPVKSRPKPTLQISKIQSKATQNMPGTPQPTDPAILLRRNLKKRVDLQMDLKIAEIPQNSSPYLLMKGETENGSPVEEFIKKFDKPTKRNVTGTPAPNAKRSRILQSLDNNVQEDQQQRSSPYPLRR